MDSESTGTVVSPRGKKAAQWSVLGGKVLFLAPHKPFFGWCFGTVLAVVSGNLQAFSCYGLVTNWQFFACGAPFVGRSPRTPLADVLFCRGAREKTAPKVARVPPSQKCSRHARNILPTEKLDPHRFVADPQEHLRGEHP